MKTFLQVALNFAYTYWKQVAIGAIALVLVTIWATWAGASRLWESHSARKAAEIKRSAEEKRLRAEQEAIRQSEIQKRAEMEKAEERRRNEEERLAIIRQAEASALEKKKAEERQAFLNRIFTKGVMTNASGIPDIAVVVASEDRQADSKLANVLIACAKERGANASTAPFSRHFVSEGVLEQVFGGTRGVLDDLSLIEAVDYILLGKLRSDFNADGGIVDGLISAKLSLELSVISTKSGTKVQDHTASVVGAGLTREEASDRARERLERALMGASLNAFFQPWISSPNKVIDKESL